MSTSAPATVFIADDHKVIRDGLTVLLNMTGEFKVIGDAGDGRALVEGVLALQPQVVITDLTMPTLTGSDAVAQLRAADFSGIVIVLSAYEDRQSVSRALRAGANGYVHKDHAFQQLVDAIKAAMAQETYLSPEIASLMRAGGIASIVDLLSMREREVFTLLAEGKNVKEIGAILGLSPKTIETHRAHLFDKLGVTNVVELSLLAVKEGIVRP